MSKVNPEAVAPSYGLTLQEGKWSFDVRIIHSLRQSSDNALGGPKSHIYYSTIEAKPS